MHQATMVAASASASTSGLALPLLLVLLLQLASSSNIFSSHWLRAVRQTLKEQEVEDINAVHKVDNHLCRRLIVMPITDAFNPHSSNQMFGKVQYGDKCSLPASIGRLIFEGEGGNGRPYDVPWLFEMKPVVSRRVRRTAKARVTADGDAAASAAASTDEKNSAPSTSSDPLDSTKRILEKAFISPLDFRSPENYIFLPRWLMRTLGLHINDVVDISFVRIKLAGLVVFQPLTLEWDALLEDPNTNPKTILEHEVNKYSSLTAGSTIEIEHNGVVYPFYIKETRGENGVAVLGVRVQDSDVKVDIDRSVLDELLRIKEEQEEAEGAGEGDSVAATPAKEKESESEVSGKAERRVPAAAVIEDKEEEGGDDDGDDEEEDEEEEEEDEEE